jgi:hypothetical protein
MRDVEPELPIESFIQALTHQLDRAQETMAMKARVGMPLTFAVKDLRLDLRAHVGMSGDVVHIRPAGPDDAEASVLHLELTTITQPMMLENAPPLERERDEPSLREVLGDEISDAERRRLEWAGIRSVSQLRDLERTTGEAAIERVAQLPVARLRAALARASQPLVREVLPVAGGPGGDGRPLLRIRGANLTGGAEPEVLVGGRRAAIVEAGDRELLVRPLGEASDGDEAAVEVRTVDGVARAYAPAAEEAAA